MNWNVPNILTMARLSVLPIIVVLLWPSLETRETCYWAALVYAVSSAMDMADGYVARRWNQVTVLGKFLDPLADKLFYLVTLIALLQLQGPRVPPLLVMIIVTRELSITGLRAIAASEGVIIAAAEGGKLKTTFASVGMVALLMHYPYVINFLFAQPTVDMHRTGLWMTYLSTAFALTSGVQYLRGFSKALRDKAAQDARRPA